MPFHALYTGTIPNRFALFTSMGLAWAWSQISWTVGVNALAKSHQQKLHLQEKLGSSAKLNFDTHHVYRTGVVLVALTALIAFGFTVFLVGLTIPRTRPIGVKYLRFHSLIMFFMSAWLFATLTALTYYVARHSEIVTAFINGKPIPQSIINEAADGLDTYFRYNKLGYWKNVAILPWLTLLFTLIAATVMWIAPKDLPDADAIEKSD